MMISTPMSTHMGKNNSTMTHILSLADQRLVLAEVSYPDRIMEIGRFRIQGWKDEKGIDPDFFSKDVWLDELDQNANHWIITHEQRIVAAARLSFHASLYDVPYASYLKASHWSRFENKRIASINRLVVHPEYRGLGLSSLLDQIRIERAIAQQADIMIAFPQYIRLKPLMRQDFELLDQLENIPEMPERPFFVMYRVLSSVE
jgi:GNAT superfamily N-acetyltransferase